MIWNFSKKKYYLLRGRSAASRNTVFGLSVLLAALGMIIFGLLPPPRPSRLEHAEHRPAALSAGALRFLASARSGDFQTVREGLKSGVDVNVQNEFGESALHVVRDPQVARFLVENGADVNLREREFGMTPLFFQESPVAEILVRAGADI